MRKYTNYSMHDVYIGEHNRVYLVTPYALAYALRRDAKSRFKVANDRIAIVTAWVIGEDLYLERPIGVRGVCSPVYAAYIKHDYKRRTVKGD